MQPTRLPKKKDVALALLEQASVFVHLDPRTDKVFVPPWLKRQPQLVLQIGLNMAIPIPVRGGPGRPLSTLVQSLAAPLPDVAGRIALVSDSGRGMVWPDDVPRSGRRSGKASQARSGEARSLHFRRPLVPAAPAASYKRSQRRSARRPARPTRKPRRPRPSRKAEKDARAAQAQGRAHPRGGAGSRSEALRSATAGASGPASRKRGLPPYLRIVK